MLSCQQADGDAPRKLLEMRTIVVDHVLFDSLKGIGKTSFDHVKINRPAGDCADFAGSGSATRAGGATGDVFDHIWKTFERSSGQVDIARPVEASAEQKQDCQRVARINGESSQFGPLRVLPLTQCIVGHSYIARD